ncbi:MAG: protoporphyrinogen oxidase [Actinomycetia bacterium]|nr:protoporphyrinogen oxidase [Actinomycetes bacterium]
MTGAAQRIAVIGGGITGLAAAHAALSHDGGHEVVLFEASDRVGGKILTSPFAGHAAIDEGPDAFLARLPWGSALARAVGLGDQLVSPAVSRAAVWWDALHPIPEGLLLGLPTEVLALARSPLLTWGGKLRAATEPLRPHTSPAPDSLGAFVRARFGDQVHLRLVDPLVGSIYAADTDHFSLAAIPQIAELANSARSVLLAGRKARARSVAATGPIFYAPVGGMGTLTSATAAAVSAAGGDIRIHAPVDELAADGRGWRVNGERFDSVILACPAATAARLLSSAAPDAAQAIATIPTAEVAIVSLAVLATEWPRGRFGLSGYLVPKPKQQLVTAVSFGSQKWAHWGGVNSVLRVSLGRDGLPVLHLSDEQLTAAAIDELSGHFGYALQPTDVRISRWPGAFPQYRPHHADLVAMATRALPEGLTLAGASYHGIGVPACIRSGELAAARAAGRGAASSGGALTE